VAKNAGHEPFEPLPEDSEQLLTLHTHLYNALKDLERSRRGLREAKLDGTPFGDHPDPRMLVDRLVDHMAPFVREISRRSMSKTELVLKRVLADDRREEIFCAKSDLLDKIAGLSPQMRKVFAPLELGDMDRLGHMEPDREEVPLPKLSSVPVPSTNPPPAPRDEDDEQTGIHDSSQPAGRRLPASQPLLRGVPATQRLGDPRSTLPGTGTPVPPPYVAQSPFGPAPSAMPPRQPLPSEQTRVVTPTPRPRFVPRTGPPPPSRPAPPRRGAVKDDTTVEVKIEETED
ncbi:MAG TPA: hypothetical protein VFB62_08500, partial [Polyangiaceae bacterium]|nr:hypothetical protein [Polyangiaceae bacterium]